MCYLNMYCLLNDEKMCYKYLVLGPGLQKTFRIVNSYTGILKVYSKKHYSIGS